MNTKFLVIALAFSLGACASSKPASETVAETKPEGKRSELKAELRELGTTVHELAKSLENPESKEDPDTLRGRIAKQEAQLRQKTSGFRARMNELLPPGKDGHDELEENIREIERQLDEIRDNASSESPAEGEGTADDDSADDDSAVES